MNKQSGKKLVEILAVELKEWPVNQEYAYQDYDKEVRFSHDDQFDFHASEMCNDFVRERFCDSPKSGVTHKMWKAERTKLSKPKANAQGWVRHRGGKCPVEAGTIIDIRMRCGHVEFGIDDAGIKWSHSGHPEDVMAYRIHHPAQQAIEKAFDMCVEKCASTEPGHVEIPDPTPIDGPLQWRDRITEIDRTVEALEEERASLIQKLADEGLQLIKRESVDLPDMSDWRVGDIMEIIGNEVDHDFPIGERVRILCPINEDGNIQCEYLDGHDFWFCKPADLKFVSRPTK